MLVKSKCVTIFLNKKTHNKEVSIQGDPSSELKDDAILTEYQNNTLNWEHVAYTVHRFSFSHTYIHIGLVTL